MSIVVFGPLVTGARGTIAGTIFSANKSGPYARGWNRGPNPRSTGQAGQRGRTSGMAKTWRGLTQVQRDAWDVWAALPAQEKFNSLGESYFASGFNWYVAINDRLLYIGRGSRATPPVIARPAAPTLSDMQIAHTGAGWNSYLQYPNGTFTGFDLILFIAMSNSQGVLTKTHAPTTRTPALVSHSANSRHPRRRRRPTNASSLERTSSLALGGQRSLKPNAPPGDPSPRTRS